MEIYSQFKQVAIGHVAKDKDRDTDIVEVYPVEILPEVDSNISKIEKINLNIDNLHKGKENINVEKKLTLKCKWLALGAGNRVTPPDVRKGETLFIYRYANTDMYYWEDALKELDLRRKEIVTYVYGNTDIFKEKLGKENTYWLTYDTVNKYIQLHTSDNDGEVCTYDLKIDTGNGVITIIDGRDNKIELNSAEDNFYLNINELIEITSKNKNIFVEELIHTTAKNKDTEIEETINTSATDINIKVKESVNVECTDATIKASNSITGETSSYTMKADKIKLDGETEITKNLTVALISKATDHISGNVSGNSHMHANAIPGNPTPPLPTGADVPKYKP